MGVIDTCLCERVYYMRRVFNVLDFNVQFLKCNVSLLYIDQ